MSVMRWRWVRSRVGVSGEVRCVMYSQQAAANEVRSWLGGIWIWSTMGGGGGYSVVGICVEVGLPCVPL